MLVSCLVVILPLLARGALSGSSLAISNINVTAEYVHGTVLGIYGVGQHIYRVSRLQPDYIHDLDRSDSRDYKIITIPDTDTNQVFYIQDAGVDESLKGDGDAAFGVVLEELMGNLKDWTSGPSNQYEYGVNQQKFRTPTAGVIHQTPTSALITVPNELIPELDMFLPRFLVSVHVPLDSALIPVPAESISRVQKWLNALKFDANVVDIVNSISVRYPSSQRSLRRVNRFCRRKDY